ncbi:MAG: hypothetical protein ACREV9_08265 [Burkholderiales bacterium]
MVALIFLALVGLTSAGYAYYRLPAHSKSAAQARWTTILLVVTGLVFGYTMATVYAQEVPPLLSFLAGFGLVHIPAAIVLFIKQQRLS